MVASSFASRRFLLLLLSPAVLLRAYNRPACPSWPSSDIFDTELGGAMDGVLHGPINNTSYDALCRVLGTDAYAISAAADGLCLHAHACAFEFCQEAALYDNYNLPAYTVEPVHEQDVAAILDFAERHDLAVTVKTTGHSYVGSSTAKDSLLIWMQNYPKDGTIDTNFTDSCGGVGSSPPSMTVIGVGGGETWNDVIQAVGPNYHVVTGGARTVSAVGGWLQGSGLSFSSRQYGLGVDQVVEFTVVLAAAAPNNNSSRVVTADACTNPDLFWALRGGGGGTYGVVTHARYRLHPVTSIVQVSWGLLGVEYLLENALYDDLFAFIRLWLAFWIRESPKLETRWAGGFFGPASVYLTFTGTIEEAKESFIDVFDAWYYNVLVPNTTMIPGVWGALPPSDTVTIEDSWYEVKGGSEAYSNPLDTDPTGDAYENVETLIGARLMPLDTVVNDPEGVENILFELATNGELSVV